MSSNILLSYIKVQSNLIILTSYDNLRFIFNTFLTWKNSEINVYCNYNRSQINMFTLLSPFEKSLMVGNPWILMSSTSLAVESIFAMTMSSLSANFSPNLSQMGTSCLQWPEIRKKSTLKSNCLLLFLTYS